jgi:predicted N-acetyltransferase YhbS
MEKLIIRNETEEDRSVVEDITRNAFWNLHAPGCDEHYLVHTMRKHEDFIPELDFIVELDGKIIGNVMYTKARLIDEMGKEKTVLTFGPLSILPEYQRRGIGKMLLDYSFNKAIELGYEIIVIFGNPGNYVSCGFKSCKKYNVCLENDVFPTAMLVKELKPNVFDGKKWCYHESPAYNIDANEAAMFDKQFNAKEKKYQASQEEFYIYSHSRLQ